MTTNLPGVLIGNRVYVETTEQGWVARRETGESIDRYGDGLCWGWRRTGVEEVARGPETGRASYQAAHYAVGRRGF